MREINCWIGPSSSTTRITAMALEDTPNCPSSEQCEPDPRPEQHAGLSNQGQRESGSGTHTQHLRKSRGRKFIDSDAHRDCPENDVDQAVPGVEEEGVQERG